MPMKTDTSMRDTTTIALLGNPNSGKSTLFNALTGLNQRIGNFPGVTVDKKVGKIDLPVLGSVDLVDFPGCYSLYPNSRDERVVVSTLTDPSSPVYPDLVVYVLDVKHLERHLLLATQLIDLQLPVVLVLNMIDQVDDTSIDIEALSTTLRTPVVGVSARYGQGIDQLKELVASMIQDEAPVTKPFYSLQGDDLHLYQDVALLAGVQTAYAGKVIAHHHAWLPHLSDGNRDDIAAKLDKGGFENLKGQVSETMQRYDKFTSMLKGSRQDLSDEAPFTTAIDRLLTHRVVGPIIFLLILFLMFQAVYSWATGPMDMIDEAFASVGSWLSQSLPEAWYTSLLVDGIVAGLGGVLIFIPQIAILFFLISVLEETGYMSRAVFMFDGLMQKVGLNGRSIVALVSSGACAIPAIMSTRTISNEKERLITILVSPLISCSARIPVYVVLVAFVVPAGNVWIFSQQGLVFIGLYLLGIISAFVMAGIFNLWLPQRQTSELMMELPRYQVPSGKNIFTSVKEKVRAFIVEAGKIIMVISVVLWALASYGPAKGMALADQAAAEIVAQQNLTGQAADDVYASQQLEASYAGIIGHTIEPIIKPLGFDWKVGIALITSFAAREVFVGTMATIYSVGSADDEATLRERMRSEIREETGKPFFDLATALSLLIFYVFAMQCMSTLAVTYKETQSWKWPMVQLTYMTALAYVFSMLAYQLFS
jgi:ferrous iron transport protein B